MKQKRVWIIVGITVLVISAVAFFVISDTAGEVAKLAAEGGEVQLREPLRPLRGGARVLLIALDGVGDEKLREAARTGLMPHVASLLGADQGGGLYTHAYAVTDALSILPSTTMAAWSSIFTGRPASETGVLGNEWYVREEMRFYAPGPISVDDHQHTLEIYTEDLLGGAIRVPTLYELADVRAHVALAPVHRGADLLTVPSLSDVAEAFGSLATGLASDAPADREIYATLDANSVDQLLETIREHGLPDLQVVYFPGVDLYTHLAEPPLEELAGYLRDVIDPAVGRILNAYAEADVLRNTYVVFVSDHGHTPVLNDERNALGSDNDDGPPELLRNSGFRMRPFVLEPADDARDYQAAVAYQGAMAYVYLADRSTCPHPGTTCSWMLPPRLEEDVLPVVRAFEVASRTGRGAPKLHGALDLILAREPRPVGEDAAEFQVWDGQRLVPIGEYLAGNPRSDLLRFEERMRGLAAGPYGHRAGDILLLARTGMNRPIEERFYFSGLYHSWHGSPEHEDSSIPLVVARAGGNGEEIRSAVAEVVGDSPSQLDVVPLVRALLGR
ncbi:MAG: alkaline phosphatase family protein [Gemmatimonadetes bacterium]|nr:alkaline phosphatase family protein [Gemmatimonadota bacterium]